MTCQIAQVDAFTSQPFAGNPAGVCLLNAPRDERWMQQVAREMNISETAFLQKRVDVELDSEAAVRNLRPDFGQLRTIVVRGVIATSRSENAQRDFVSRYFAPAFGIDEDPVTGSAHCCLAPFWSARLHKTTFLAHQISARGGVLKVQLNGDRVILHGQAVTVLQGDLLA